MTKLELFRKEKGLSRKELSLKSHISLRTIEHLEQKDRDIKKSQYNIIKALADALNCKIEDLID